MNSLWEYLLNVSIGFSLLYGIYWLLYRKKTFHSVNRLILLFIIIASLSIPILEIPQRNLSVSNTIVVFDMINIAHFTDNLTAAPNGLGQKTIVWLDLLKAVYFIGLLVFSIRFIFHISRLFVLRMNSNTKKSAEQVLVYTKQHLPPFSFFHWIFLPEDEFAHIDQHPIIEHERAHAKQWHSFDLLLTEIFSIFLWFVPFVYSFKNSIKGVHEYLADSHTIQHHSNPIEYLNLLALDTEKYTIIGLSNHFYFKTLKNRITMITKHKSTSISRIQYLLMIPALALITFACSNFDNSEQNQPSELVQPSVVDAQSTSFKAPIEASKSEISSGFGMRIHPIKKVEMMHNGIDFKADSGTPVMAIANGVIIKEEFMEGTYGNVLVVEHANGYVSLYAQLSEFKTELGATVKQGQTIGLVGSSGISTGPHLHFEIQKEGKYFDPSLLIQ